jgi:ATP-dependent DNA helicase Q5
MPLASLIVTNDPFCLFQDQIDQLKKINVRAESVNSSMAMTERTRVLNDLKTVSPDTVLLYITPELVAQPWFQVRELDF